MRQIVLSTVAVALIAASASQALAAQSLAAEALAAQSRPNVRKDSAVSDQTRKGPRRSQPTVAAGLAISGLVRARGPLTLAESTGTGFVPSAFEKDIVMAVCGLKPQICPQHRI
ncbi:hypothetical protein [Bradyrhizobium japonicum]|uniref:hypothetical protein n=1 Tax=Bradyrhizobium japonicum TaxID=375 RepID=UPI0020129C1D|nr:hypothetical protein [Bradyrhizobium japonicum]